MKAEAVRPERSEGFYSIAINSPFILSLSKDATLRASGDRINCGGK